MSTIRVIKVEGCIEALSPIAHFGDEKTGSTPMLRRVGIFDRSANAITQIPFISGNAIRGMLRRLVMRDFFELLGVEDVETNPRLYHAFYTGGALEAVDKGGGEINLAFKRSLRKKVPPLSLFGAMLGNQNFPGVLKVGNAFPLCREYASFAGESLPEFMRNDPRTEHSVRRFVGTTFSTRRDDLRAERADDEQAMQMKVDYEVFAPGTAFYHWFSLHYATEVEAAVLRRALSLWHEAPYVGGKSSSGEGLVRFHYPEEDALPDESIYLDFLEQHCDDVRKAIFDLASFLESVRKK